MVTIQSDFFETRIFGIMIKFSHFQTNTATNKKLNGPGRQIFIQECQLTCQLSPEFFMKVWEYLGAEKSDLK